MDSNYSTPEPDDEWAEDPSAADPDPPLEESKGSSPLEDLWRSIVNFFEQNPDLKPVLWQGKIGPAFWTVAGVLSITLNIVLVIMLVLIGRQLFGLKGLVQEQLVGGLRENFVLMDQAVIEAIVPVDDVIPIEFMLPVQTQTNVVLTQDTLLTNASVNLQTGGLRITDAATDIVLRAGTELPINLSIEVPVKTEIPVHLEVAVVIPMEDTELHTPFVGLQNVVTPYDTLLSETPGSWGDAFCRNGPSFLCALFR